MGEDLIFCLFRTRAAGVVGEIVCESSESLKTDAVPHPAVGCH